MSHTTKVELRSSLVIETGVTSRVGSYEASAEQMRVLFLLGMKVIELAKEGLDELRDSRRLNSNVPGLDDIMGPLRLNWNADDFGTEVQWHVTFKGGHVAQGSGLLTRLDHRNAEETPEELEEKIRAAARVIMLQIRESLKYYRAVESDRLSREEAFAGAEQTKPATT